MVLWHLIVLAVVQGLTEFLPISSSAHLILVPWLFHWTDDPGLAFDVALHAGTLIAVAVYFIREWIQLTLCGLGFHYPSRASEDQVLQSRRLFWYLVAGTIPGAVFGFLLEKKAEAALRNPISIAIAMIAMGLLMWYGDYSGRKERHLTNVSLGDSLFVGFGQALALFPGVSRSGITITAGLFRGLTREAAARFSFLLSTPIIAGAALVEVPKLLKAHKAGTLDMSLGQIGLCVGISAIVGFLVIEFFLQYLQTRTLKIFVYYRILFGILILSLAFLHWGSAR
jgi:undecaprenyl-diphosphatase